MLLAIDVGNTNIVFALVDEGRTVWQWRIASSLVRTADEYAVWLHQLLEMEGVARTAITRVIIASVVPQILFNLEEFAHRFVGVRPLVVGTADFRYGMRINLPNPLEVGADRMVNAVAAHDRWPGGSIVVDFGTATTFDVVGAGGSYEGGVIAPGINLSADALDRATAKLPRVAVEPPPDGLGVTGKSTIHAMKSGLFWGYVGLIEGIVARLKDEIDGHPAVVATGGLATLFQQHCRAIDHVAPDLTVHGLVLLDKLNRGETS